MVRIQRPEPFTKAADRLRKEHMGVRRGEPASAEGRGLRAAGPCVALDSHPAPGVVCAHSPTVR